ncbi:protein FAM8A1 isoform X2 [Scaptodrosophila lebanonensis]|uniref:Protein FAM8A1 isoform X2 n=1 Tax=Drosophila lebanonensis TaxID=7225 RepID=A0A6J2T6S7_DROLE|nr:protein FAM8A1 isoform X2 [Scaptodrosophila lebanonensis]
MYIGRYFIKMVMHAYQKYLQRKMSENTDETTTIPENTTEANGEGQKLIETNNKEMSTKEAYFASLRAWAKQATMTQNATAMFPYYLLANYYPHLFQAQGSSNLPYSQAASQAQAAPIQPNAPVAAVGAARPHFNRFRMLDEIQQQEIIQRVGGYEYVVAPFWKRALAEAIDFIILLLLKIIITFAIVSFLDLNMGFDIHKDVIRKTLDDEDILASFFDLSVDFLTLSSDLILIELMTKLIVCFYEAIWTVWYNGATPGKALMKIRILYVEAVVPLQGQVVPQFLFQAQREPLRALLYPAETPTLVRAFMRALAKNLVMTLLFPICVVMVFFKNNRTAYDIFAKTVVVIDNPNVLHRQPPQ